mmetsp:Transcript_8173/g.20524  ORF Transcript_8173/g.20524 Transcript_8173/m.20524 type:complete len:430 (+) Transcript_8173:874-2163(+)
MDRDVLHDVALHILANGRLLEVHALRRHFARPRGRITPGTSAFVGRNDWRGLHIEDGIGRQLRREHTGACRRDCPSATIYAKWTSASKPAWTHSCVRPTCRDQVSLRKRWLRPMVTLVLFVDASMEPGVENRLDFKISPARDFEDCGKSRQQPKEDKRHRAAPKYSPRAKAWPPKRGVSASSNCSRWRGDEGRRCKVFSVHLDALRRLGRAWQAFRSEGHRLTIFVILNGLQCWAVALLLQICLRRRSLACMNASTSGGSELQNQIRILSMIDRTLLLLLPCLQHGPSEPLAPPAGNLRDPTEDVDIHHGTETPWQQCAALIFANLADVQQEHEPQRMGHIHGGDDERHERKLNLEARRVHHGHRARDKCQDRAKRHENDANAELHRGERHVKKNQQHHGGHEEPNDEVRNYQIMTRYQHVGNHVVALH